MTLLQRIRSWFAPAKPAPAKPAPVKSQVAVLNEALVSAEMFRQMREDTVLRRMIADSEYGERGSATPPKRIDRVSVRRVEMRPELAAPYKRQEDSIVPFLAGLAAYEYVAHHSTPDPTPSYSAPDPIPTVDAGGGSFGGGGASGEF